jgi:hypothetical protein
MASRLWSEIRPDLRTILTGLSLTTPRYPLDQEGRYAWGTVASIKTGGAVEAQPTGGGYQYVAREVHIQRGVVVGANLSEDETQDTLIDAQDALLGAFLYDGNQPEGVNNIYLVEMLAPVQDESNEWIIEIVLRIEYAVDVP